jgi:hypothetical protein
VGVDVYLPRQPCGSNGEAVTAARVTWANFGEIRRQLLPSLRAVDCRLVEICADGCGEGPPYLEIIVRNASGRARCARHGDWIVSSTVDLALEVMENDEFEKIFTIRPPEPAAEEENSPEFIAAAAAANALCHLGWEHPRVALALGVALPTLRGLLDGANHQEIAAMPKPPNPPPPAGESAGPKAAPASRPRGYTIASAPGPNPMAARIISQMRATRLARLGNETSSAFPLDRYYPKEK